MTRVVIGNAVVYHADSYALVREIGPRAFGLLLTDPMWGSGADGKKAAGGNAKGGSNKRGSHYLGGMVVDNKDWQIEDDGVSFDPAPFLGFRRVVLWGANHFSHRLPGHNPKWLVWNKRPNGTPSDNNSDCELAWTNLPGQAVRKYDHLWRGVCRSGRENLSRGGAKLHPFQKPVGLGKFCIKQAKLAPGEAVIDFFAGSGAFGVAALEMGHPVVLVEKERHFFETCCEQVERAQMQPAMVV
ncbi:MAG: site-specific DNA-methyltransferase [Acidobacteriota bacterium]|nr:site-specific DNA-methyltransferase [Acidobacteriota bacterium]